MTPRLLSASVALAWIAAAGLSLSHDYAQAATSSSPAATATPMVRLRASELTLERLYRAKTYAGQAARNLHFSEDGRYLAYLWNPYGENGSDLYVYDTQTGQSKRITSPAIMQAYDSPEDLARFNKKGLQKEHEEAERQAKAEAQAAYLRGEKVDLSQWETAALEVLKRELAEKKAKDAAKKAELDAEAAKEKAAAAAARVDGKSAVEIAEADRKAEDAEKKAAKLSDKPKELWELRDELKKKLEKEKLKPSDLYPGVEDTVWAKTRNELIFQYRGDLFRLKMADGKIEPLAQTGRMKRIVSYNADDSGYLYMDDKRVYSARFDRGTVLQLNRELWNPDDEEKKYKITDTVLSEDKQWMAIFAEAPEPKPEGDAKPAPAERQVEIMNYNGRFATAKKVAREVSDDKRKVLASALYIRRVGDVSAKQPEPVFTNAGGDIWFEMSKVSWAKDGSRYTFSTWEREKELLRIYVGKAEEGVKPAMVFERRGKVGHEVVNVLSPRFTPDGSKLIAILDEDGFRQPYVIDAGNGSAHA
ncbi:MAG TPA: hypothetical protein VK751_14635, partial [Undibacterium sp.]|nr:hypothetical protein [Undibacterium sp.]